MSTEQPVHRRPGGTLYRYISREMVFPTAFALGGLTLVVLTKNVLGYSEMVINRGLGFDAVSWIAFYQLVPLAAQMTPFAVLVGCLVALGRLGADRELLVLEASGLSVRRLVGPVAAFAAAMTAVSLVLSVVASPWANRSLDAAFSVIAQERPAAVVRAGIVQEFGDWKLEAREVSASGEKLRSVVAWVPSIGETVFAKRGELAASADGGTELRLHDGVVMLDPRRKPRELRYNEMRAVLPRTEDSIGRDDVERLDGLTLTKLSRLLNRREGDAADDRKTREARVELHRRFALPLAAMVFGVLVLPLFLARAQFSRSGGAILGVIATVAYYGLVQLGGGLIQSGAVPVPLGVWFPNAVLGLAALLLFMRAGRQTVFSRHQPRGRRWWSAWLGGAHAADPENSAVETRGASPSVRRTAAPRQIVTHRFALQRYVAQRFLQMLAVCFAISLIAYLLVDVLERLQWFTKYEATAGEVLRFYGARMPLLASRVVPMSLLVATALTVGLLAVQGELTGIRSCGIAAPHALLPILFICALIAPASFVLNNNIVPRSNALADYLKQTQIKGEGGPGSVVSAVVEDTEKRIRPVWYRVGNHFYEAGRLDPLLGRAQSVTVYELGPDGLPVSRVEARAARHIGGGVWRLVDPLRIDRTPEGLRAVPAEPFADLGEDVPAEVDTMHLSVGELLAEIEELESSGYPTTHYAVDLVVKLVSPLACLVLPALALVFCVSGPPYPSSALSLVLSAAVAVAYTLLTGVSVSLGYGGALPAWLAGSAPTAGFGFLAIYFGLRLRGFGQTF